MLARTILIVAAIPLLLAQGQGTGAQNDAVRVIQRLEDEMNTAFNRYDAATLDRLWSEELTFVTLSGTVANKAQRLAGLKTRPANIPVSTNESVAVNMYGDVAVAIVLSKWSGTTDGKPTSSHYRATHVWAKRAGDWKLVAAHVTQLKD
ncbi:MAG TPA: nuclear transport factor 2 family protein [Terriglobia bacterium]|nr:nuclear transport factor 2 family protein [Terriglobia bacterium]